MVNAVYQALAPDDGEPDQKTLNVMPTNIKTPAAIASILEAPLRVNARIVPASARRAKGHIQLSEREPSDSKMALPNQLKNVMAIDVTPRPLRHCGSFCREPFVQFRYDKMASEGIAMNMTIPRVLLIQLSGML